MGNDLSPPPPLSTPRPASLPNPCITYESTLRITAAWPRVAKKLKHHASKHTQAPKAWSPLGLLPSSLTDRLFLFCCVTCTLHLLTSSDGLELQLVSLHLFFCIRHFIPLHCISLCIFLSHLWKCMHHRCDYCLSTNLYRLRHTTSTPSPRSALLPYIDHPRHATC